MRKRIRSLPLPLATALRKLLIFSSDGQLSLGTWRVNEARIPSPRAIPTTRDSFWRPVPAQHDNTSATAAAQRSKVVTSPAYQVLGMLSFLISKKHTGKYAPIHDGGRCKSREGAPPRECPTPRERAPGRAVADGFLGEWPRAFGLAHRERLCAIGPAATDTLSRM